MAEKPGEFDRQEMHRRTTGASHRGSEESTTQHVSVKAKQRTRSAHKYLLNPPVLTIYTMIVMAVGGLVAPDPVQSGNDTAYLTLLIVEVMAFVLPAILLIKLRPPQFVNRLQLRLFSLQRVPLLLCMSLFMICALSLFKLILQGLDIYHPTARILWGISTPVLGIGALDSTYTLLVFVLVPAVAQGFYHQGVMYGHYSSVGVAASVVSSALFGAMSQFTVGDFLVQLLAGLILSFTVYLCRSVWAAVVVRLVYHLFVVSFERYIWSFVNKPDGMIFFSFVAGTLTLLFFILSAGEAQHIMAARSFSVAQSQEKSQHFLSAREQLSAVFVDYRTVVCVLLYIVALFVLYNRL